MLLHRSAATVNAPLLYAIAQVCGHSKRSTLLCYYTGLQPQQTLHSAMVLHRSAATANTPHRYKLKKSAVASNAPLRYDITQVCSHRKLSTPLCCSATNANAPPASCWFSDDSEKGGNGLFRISLLRVE